jgi:hypothetical protein
VFHVLVFRCPSGRVTSPEVVISIGATGMSESINQFKVSGSKTEVEDASRIATPPPTNQAPQVQVELNLQRIDTLRITGPLIVFFGPRAIGKTVTLLRLCTYIRSRYHISPDQNFRTDDEYPATIAAFEAMLQVCSLHRQRPVMLISYC